MVRSRKSHAVDEENTKLTRKLHPAYSGRAGGNIYVVYADYAQEGETISRVLVLNFLAEYAAAWFIQSLIHKDEYEWIDPIGSRECIRTSSDIRISMFGDDLTKLLNYKPSSDEEEWSDEEVHKSIMRFKYGKSEDKVTHETIEDNDSEHPSSSKPERTRIVKEPKTRIDRTGMVSANDIAKELGVEGREVRGVLRGMKLIKPEGGWLFDKKTAEDIRDKVKKGLKEAKKK